MKGDRLKWNRKYATTDYPLKPSAIVQQYHQLATVGRALDIAAGNGRNAVFLARHGFQVEAIDISDVGLKAGCCGHSGVDPVCADLNHFEIARHRYDLIINIKYLNRRLFPYIISGLKSNGILIFETFVGHLHADENGSDSPHFLRTNELLHAFLPLHILYYQEQAVVGCHKGPTRLASLVATKTPLMS